MLPDMIAPFVDNPRGDARWLTAEKDAVAVGLCYAQAEMMTEGTWNMLAIAVDPAMQGQGAGAALVSGMEDLLRGAAARLLVVDTSGTEDFIRTRAFYASNAYTQEATIRDFWAAGDDKVIFTKAL